MKKVIVRVPATTANLGPGFDSLGLALDLWNEAEFSRGPKSAAHRTGGNKHQSTNGINLTIEGEGEDSLPRDESNAIVGAALQLFQLMGKEPDGLNIHCINRIPLVSGMGSSSAALLTGMLGANRLLGNPFRRDEILKMATQSEGHPDNVVPAMLGGLVASAIKNGEVVSRKLLVSPMTITVVMPDYYFPTKAAREILPEYVLREDAIFNLSRAVLVIKALETGDLPLLGEIMEDSLHQPYRLPLIPGALEAIQAAKKAGASGVALSGAGPSLIAFSGQPADAEIGNVMKEAFERAGLAARIFPLNISHSGASVIERTMEEKVVK